MGLNSVQVGLCFASTPWGVDGCYANHCSLAFHSNEQYSLNFWHYTHCLEPEDLQLHLLFTPTPGVWAVAMEGQRTMVCIATGNTPGVEAEKKAKLHIIKSHTVCVVPKL